MAFPVTSGWFGDSLADILTGTDINLDTATIKVALFTNSFDDAGSTGGAGSFDKNTDQGTYGSGEWTTGYEVSSANYTAGGSALTNPSITTASGKVIFRDTASTLAWSSVTFTARGMLCYADLATDRGISYNTFGGDVSVSSGTFTITWPTIDATTGIAYISF